MSFKFPPFQSGLRAHAPMLTGSSDAWYLAEAARGGQTLAVFTANAWDAQRLLEEIRWFAPDIDAHLFPDWETLPYDAFSPHPDLVSERLATLYQLARGQFQIVLAPLSTALYRLAPPSFLLAHTFFLK